MKQLAASLLMLFAGAANAALVLDYTGGKTGDGHKTEVSDSRFNGEPKKLLLDNSIQWATFLDSEKCIEKPVNGSGTNLPLSTALKILTPNGWRVYADDDVDLSMALVGWRNGAMWTRIISDAAEKHKFKVTFNCSSKEVTFKSSPSLGVLHSEDNFDSFGEGLIPTEVAPTNEATTFASGPIYAGNPSGNPVDVRLGSAPSASKAGEPSPLQNETLSQYVSRYADHYGYSRVAYRLKKTNGDSVMRLRVASGNKSGTFSEFLQHHKLMVVNGVDASSNVSVLILTDDSTATGRGDLLVFAVKQGFVSENAVALANATGLSIGEDNVWPNLGVDYKVPYGYDIVMTEPVDGFMELFAKYPLQAQMVMGTKTVFVVKRNSPNRK